MVEAFLYILIGGAVGGVLIWLMAKNQSVHRLATLREELNADKQRTVDALREAADVEKKQLNGELSKALQAVAVAENTLKSERQQTEVRLEDIRTQHAKELADVKSHAEQMRQEQQKQHDERNKLVQEEIRNMAMQMLADSKKAITAENKERMEILLTPLKERLEAFQKAVNDNSKESSQNKAEIKTVFEEAMKKLHDEQERTVRELKEQTERIGNDAASLTQALKGDSKMQGDWGEMILDKTLEDCGLERDVHYFLQPNYKDEQGNNFRPDAVIEFPSGERAVIDSKVSLTAYQESVLCEDETEQSRLIKEHVASVRAHVDELSDKEYEKIVPHCIGYVLMFIPYESGYSAALKADSSLLQYAYRKHIIILSPSNLLMALQLTHTMWQNYRINKNVEEILRQSNDLYDKFVNFAETFMKIEGDIQKIQKDFDVAKGQLRDGRGNIIRRLDGMKTLGITPKKQIPDSMQ